ncbi:TPA: hypothetical protein QHB43_001178 [Aeromonas hydrophila subsp. hydrophila]|nr:hypothetical protein [Aeromonas hydrophila subsp. hydrophila]
MKYTVELQKVIDNMDLSRLSLSEIYVLSDYMNKKAGDKFSSLMTPLRKEDLCDELKAEISNHVGKVVNADTGEIIQDDNGHITGVGLKSDPIQFSAASLNVSLGNKEDLVAMCRYENGKLEINNAMIGELKAETIKAGCIPTTHVQPGIPFKALDNAIKNERAAREAADEKLAKSIQDADQNMLQFSARECRKAFKAKQLNDSIRVVGEAVRQGKITLNQARELLNLPAVKDGDYYVAQDEKERVVSDEMNKALADYVKQCKQNRKQMQELEFKPENKEGDIRRDGIITRLTAELQQQGTAIARSIHVEAFVDMFIHLAECKVPAGQEYKYAEHQARKMIEFMVHTLRK